MIFVKEEIALFASAFLKKGLGVSQDLQDHRDLLDPWESQDRLGFQERKGGEGTVALLEQQGTKETRVQLVFLDFQVWMAYLATQGLQDPEASQA